MDKTVGRIRKGKKKRKKKQPPANRPLPTPHVHATESRVCWGSDDIIKRKIRLESSGPILRVVDVTPSPRRISRSDSSAAFSRSDLHRAYACGSETRAGSDAGVTSAAR